MKLNENFVVREIAGSFVAVPLGETAIDFNGIIKLNEAAKFLWDSAAGDFTEEGLIKALINEYDISEATAKEAVTLFIKQMKDAGCIE